MSSSDQVPNFRASAWIPYAPNNNSTPNTASSNTNSMDHDVDMMDAPPISTLSEESGPPPPAPHPKDSHVSKFRVKLKVNRPSSRAASVAPVTEGRGNKSNKRKDHNGGTGAGKGEDESRGEGTPDSQDSEEEWDQLADDDDIAPSSSVIGTPSRGARQHRDHASASSTPARGGRTSGRGGRGGRGRGRGRGGAAVGATEPPQTIFEIAPSVAHAEHGTPGLLDAGSAGTGSPSPSKAAPRRRVKKTEEKEKKKTGRKPRASKALMQLQDDAASVASESFAGTVASSPLARGGDFSTPELEPIPLTLPPAGIPDGRDAPTVAPGDSSIHLNVPQPAQPNQQQNPNQPFTLDPTIPVPVYRLPTKPFLVQAPPKIPAGFAPVIPLDKGPAARAPVRRWRTALRAIRGIAGGQWVVRTWVGEKESVYANVTGRDVLHVQGQGTTAGGAENAVPIQAAFAHGHGHVGGGGGGGRGRGSANASALASPALSASKLPSGSSGGGKVTARSKLAGAVSTGGGAGAGSTADSSRAGSVDVIPNPNSGPLPEGVSAPGMTIRPLSKMRHTVSATDTEVAIDDAL